MNIILLKIISQDAYQSSSVTDVTEHHWNEAKDSEGRSYYFNSSTGEVSWDIPAEMLISMPVVKFFLNILYIFF